MAEAARIVGAASGAHLPLPRTMDATVLNAVANEPAVRQAMAGGAHVIDLGPFLADPDNLAFADERGGFWLQRLDAARYELHTLFAPDQRGSAVLRHAADVIRAVFVQTSCLEIVTRVPGNLKGADFMARRAGFREVWTLPEAWEGPDGRVSLRMFSLTLDEWMQRDPSLIAEGEKFHALLDEASAAAGQPPTVHPRDNGEHERAVGMACLMAKAGNHDKAVWSYGRWAHLACFRPLQALTLNPPVYHAGNAIVQFVGGSMEILSCLPQQQ